VTGEPVIGLAGWAFLLLAGVLLPLATVAFALSERPHVVDAHGGEGHSYERRPSRLQLYGQVLFTHAVLVGVALIVARVERLRLFPPIQLDLRDAATAAGALIAVLSMGELSWRLRSVAERERLWVRGILPRNAAERRAWILVSAGAAVAEEVAYRGVFVAIAASATGSIAVAIVASAVSFAIVHAPQGLSGVGYVFIIALIHQALVIVTGSLLPAIAVHFAYDVLAGLWLARRHGLITAAGVGSGEWPAKRD
jgi:membrane protease YdiL (CAAX protease family)